MPDKGNPQIENGYTKIANELLDALCKTKMPGTSRQIFNVILRRTYGFNRKKDSISLSQFSEMTGIERRNCLRTIKYLESMNIIKVDNKNFVSEYAINKDYKNWKLLSRVTTVPKNSNCTHRRPQFDSGMTTVRLIDDHKFEVSDENNKRKKDNIKETIKEREILFKNSLIPYIGKYSNELLKSFYNYWTEPNKKNTRLRFEDQKFFDIGRRLGTFKRNANKRRQYNGKQQLSQEQQEKLRKAREDLFKNDNQ